MPHQCGRSARQSATLEHHECQPRCLLLPCSIACHPYQSISGPGSSELRSKAPGATTEATKPFRAKSEEVITIDPISPIALQMPLPQAGVLLGFSAGSGFVLKRGADGRWSAPCFLSLRELKARDCSSQGRPGCLHRAAWLSHLI